MLQSKHTLAFFLLFLGASAHGQVITKYAGSYVAGYSGDGAAANVARLNQPAGVYSDKAGNIYIAEFGNHVVRKVSSSGIITTIAGTGTGGYSGDGGPATAAKLYHPTHVASDGAGNIYIADAFNHVIRKVSTAGIITTVAGNNTTGYTGDNGPATDAQLEDPNGVWADAAGNVYIADAHNNVIRKVNTSGTISTIIGNGYNAGTTHGGYSGDGGPATAAELFYPESITMDNAGNFYLAELYNHTVRKVNTAGIISTIAGINTPAYSGDGGPATAAALGYSYDVTVNSAGVVYIADQQNDVIRSIDASGIMHTYAGNGVTGSGGDGGPATVANMNVPVAVAVDQHDDLYVADSKNNVIRKVSLSTLGVNTFPSSANQHLAVFPDPSTGIFTISFSSGSADKATIMITNVAGQTIKEFTAVAYHPVDVKLDAPSGMYFITAITPAGKTTTQMMIK